MSGVAPASGSPSFVTGMPLTGLVPGTGVMDATDSILEALGKLSGLARYTTIAAAEAATDASEGIVCYVDEAQSFYRYCPDACGVRDGDLVLNTGDGGNTRWEMLQKTSRTFGDTGIVDRDAAVLSVPNTTTLRLAVSTVFTYAIKGRRKTLAIGSHEITFTGAARVIYVFFDDLSGVLKQGNTFFDFHTQAPIAVVFWGGTTIGGVQTEFHGIRDAVWHAYQHVLYGTQYKSGFTFTGNEQLDNTNNPADGTVEYLWSTPGTIADEDTDINVDATGQWAQVLGTGLTSTTAMVMQAFYWNGTRVAGVAAMADRTAFVHAGGNTYPQWNNGGTLEAALSGDYVVYHYFAAPFINGQSVFMRPHNAKFATLALAQTATPGTLVWTAFSEYKHLYTAIFRCRSSFTNATHRCKLVSLRSYRLVAGTAAAGISATDHQALSNRASVNAHPITSVFATIAGSIPYYSATTLGLKEASTFTWDEVTGILSTPKLNLTDIAGSTGQSDLRYNTTTKEVFYDTSAMKYKTNVKDATGTERIFNLKVVLYDRKDGTTVGETGLIADEVAKVIPELVYRDESGSVEGYNKSDLVPFLLAEIQRLRKDTDRCMKELKIPTPKKAWYSSLVAKFRR